MSALAGGLWRLEQTEFIIGVVVFIGVAFLGLAVYASRYKRVPPDKAMVVYGRRAKEGRVGYSVITGGGKFIVPIVEAYEFLRLDVRTLDVVVTDIVTDVRQSGAKLNIKAVAQARGPTDMEWLPHAST